MPALMPLGVKEGLRPAVGRVGAGTVVAGRVASCVGDTEEEGIGSFIGIVDLAGSAECWSSDWVVLGTVRTEEAWMILETLEVTAGWQWCRFNRLARKP